MDWIGFRRRLGRRPDASVRNSLHGLCNTAMLGNALCERISKILKLHDADLRQEQLLADAGKQALGIVFDGFH